MSEDESQPEQPDRNDDTPARLEHASVRLYRRAYAHRWTCAALLLIGLGLTPLLGPLAEGGLRNVSATMDRPLEDVTPGDSHWRVMANSDIRFVAWQVARNARTLLRDPLDVYQAGMCFPSPRSLAYGPSGLALGVLGIPAEILSGDPVLVFNSVVLLTFALSALLMYWLVRDWTGIPGAGIAAALFYAFHYMKFSDVIHLYVRDNTWTILALFFATRLFTRRRTIDAVGLAFAGLMHMAGSVYPMLAALLVAPFIAAHLVRTHGWRAPNSLHVGGVVVVVALGAAFLLGPYFQLEAGGDLGSSAFQLFVPLHLIAPGRPGFPGYFALLCVVAALALPAARIAGGGPTPRWAILGALLLLASASLVDAPSTGTHAAIIRRGDPMPGHFPNTFLLLERSLPGMSLGRGPGSLYFGVHMLLAVLVGFGVASITRSTPAARRTVVLIALIALIGVETTRPRWLGLERFMSYTALQMRPSPERFALFDAIARDAAHPVLLEVPASSVLTDITSRSMLQSAYHGWPTSQCYSPYLPTETREVRRLARDLAKPGALASLAQMGFTHVILHHVPGDPRTASRRARFEAAAQSIAGDLGLERIATSEDASAYRITGRTDAGPAAGARTRGGALQNMPATVSSNSQKARSDASFPLASRR